MIDLKGVNQFLVNFAQLARLGMAPLTMSVPLLGAVVAEPHLTSVQIIGLLSIGLSAHIVGFSVNNIVDRHLDEAAQIRRPLTKTQLPHWQAWLVALIQIPLALTIYLMIGGNSVGISLLLSSVLCSFVYNRWSKWGRLPRFLAEFSLALSIGSLCLAGSLSQTSVLTSQAVIFAITLGLILLLLNSVPSGLKDLKTDSQFGARSFVIAAGCKIAKNNIVIIPKRLRIYSGLLQVVVVVALVINLIMRQESIWLALVVLALAFYAGMHLRLVLTSTTYNQLLKTKPLLSGYYNYFAVAIVLITQMPFLMQCIYGAGVLCLLGMPWYSSWRLWHRRYYPIVK